ncbi:MAG: hypothetical protein OEY19_10055 [Gammaproteobacteria bacterium]|nr:hypothetical protein [Gammaproteobacteria bacterium]
MYKTSLIISLTIFSTITLSQENAEENSFEPVWDFQAYFDNSSFSTFTVKEVKFDEVGGYIGFKLSWRPEPDWQYSINVSNPTTHGLCFFGCGEYAVNSNNELVRAAYSATILEFGATYIYQLSEDFSFRSLGGFVVGNETIETETCADYSSSGFFGGPYCRSNATVVRENISNTESSWVAGFAFNYHYAKNWELELGTKWSGYKEGVRTNWLGLSYRF